MKPEAQRSLGELLGLPHRVGAPVEYELGQHDLLADQNELCELLCAHPGGLLVTLRESLKQPTGTCHESATPILADLGFALF